jgi:ketosteroid isomerase-like protein
MKRVLVGALAGLLLPFAAAAGPREDLLAVDQAFSDMSLAKGPHAAFLAYMADDVRLYDGDNPPIQGKQTVADYYAHNPDSPDDRLEWTPSEADASSDGTLGWTRGTWIYTGKNPDGSAQRITGYYVTAWKKQADGQYKFTLDIGGVDKPPTD